MFAIALSIYLTVVTIWLIVLILMTIFPPVVLREGIPRINWPSLVFMLGGMALIAVITVWIMTWLM